MPYRNGQLVNWKVKVRGLRSLLNTEETTEEAKKVGQAIYNLITKNHKYSKAFKDFDRLDDFEVVETLEEFNDLLSEMYDYCDAELIWIDFK